MSLANHYTYDKGIKYTDIYFQKILNILDKQGILIIESHHPQYENLGKFQNIIDQLLKKKFYYYQEG